MRWICPHDPGRKNAVGLSSLRKNKGGDSHSDAGTIEPGAGRGTWTQTGGTGVFAGKNGSDGWWQVTMDDGKCFVGHLGR